MRKRSGVRIDKQGNAIRMYAVPTGQMADGSLVWTECTEDKEEINTDDQYYLTIIEGVSVFMNL